MAPQKPRCTFKECKSAAQRIVGDCGFCDGHFCAKHRLLEDHKCSGLEDVSMNPTPSMSRGGPDWPPSRWWLVGLADYLVEAGLDQEECCGVQEGVARAQCRTARGRADTSHPRRINGDTPDPLDPRAQHTDTSTVALDRETDDRDAAASLSSLLPPNPVVLLLKTKECKLVGCTRASER
ncbi:hypothetical protein GGS26DRAFT_587615 [Hypomontagnella submonticulosa]|nr:hypothetical protein GGS26DRAFT_587615 [Hypomontagnella submonticulosa]